MKQDYRQGEVILKRVQSVPKGAKKLSHLVLAEGEITGHKHEIRNGNAELFEKDGTLFLRVHDEEVTIVHPEHKPNTIKTLFSFHS